jgi:hypothetical protein
MIQVVALQASGYVGTSSTRPPGTCPTWVWDVMEVKVTGTPDVSVNFSIDDLHVGIR